jgi:hypothetical protein
MIPDMTKEENNMCYSWTGQRQVGDPETSQTFPNDRKTSSEAH